VLRGVLVPGITGTAWRHSVCQALYQCCRLCGFALLWRLGSSWGTCEVQILRTGNITSMGLS